MLTPFYLIDNAVERSDYWNFKMYIKTRFLKSLKLFVLVIFNECPTIF